MGTLAGKQLFPFIAPPNGGKGTQTQILSERYHLPRVDMGAMLREVAAEDTPLGHTVRDTQAQGKLVSREIVIQVLAHGLNKLAEQHPESPGFILDGFPRSQDQVTDLETLCTENHCEIGLVVYLHVPDSVIVARADNRRFCKACGAIYNLVSKPPSRPGYCDTCHTEDALYQRNDDIGEKVQVRLDSFAQETQPILAYFKNKHLLAEINGDGPVDSITQAIEAVLVPKLQRTPVSS